MHNASVSAPPKTFSPEITRRIIQIQVLTLAWMSVEAVVSLGAAWAARSPSLLGFGGDSAVELLSAAVVLWRFQPSSRGEHAEQRAARIAGGLLFVLAAFVAFAAVLALLGHASLKRSFASSKSWAESIHAGRAPGESVKMSKVGLIIASAEFWPFVAQTMNHNFQLVRFATTPSPCE